MFINLNLASRVRIYIVIQTHICVGFFFCHTVDVGELNASEYQMLDMDGLLYPGELEGLWSQGIFPCKNKILVFNHLILN